MHIYDITFDHYFHSHLCVQMRRYHIQACHHSSLTSNVYNSFYICPRIICRGIGDKSISAHVAVVQRILGYSALGYIKPRGKLPGSYQLFPYLQEWLQEYSTFLGGPSSGTLTFFPYLWFLGGSQLKKSPCILQILPGKISDLALLNEKTGPLDQCIHPQLDCRLLSLCIRRAFIHCLHATSIWEVQQTPIHYIIIYFKIFLIEYGTYQVGEVLHSKVLLFCQNVEGCPQQQRLER